DRTQELVDALAVVEQARRQQGQARAAAQEAETRAAEQLAVAQRALSRLQDQREMLSRLRDEGAGLSTGVRAVLAAARGIGSAGRPAASQAVLSGILGALGDLIEVPPELERAIEAALGGRIQDVVVRRWEDAEAAMAFLKETRAGRATFLPLDTLRPGWEAEVPRAPGVIGLASKLIQFDPLIRPAVELALNHTIVVEDLAVARRLLSRPGSATLVTLDGEIVRPGGSVTGGAENRARDGGVLARSRALRELPPQIEAAQERLTVWQERVQASRQEQRAARTALDALQARREELNAAQSRLTAEQNRLQLTLERARQAKAWHEERRRDLARDAAALVERGRELAANVATLTEQLAAGEAEVAELSRQVAELVADDLLAQLAQLRAEAAVSAGQLQSQEARMCELQETQAQRERELAAKQARIAALQAQGAEAGEIIERQTAIAKRLAQEVAALQALIESAESRLAALDVEQRRAEAQERDLREQLRHAQMRQNQAQLTLQRAQDEVAHLRREIEKELGLVELEEPADSLGALASAQPPLPLNGMVTRLDSVPELPEGLDADVRNLRAQIARLGPVNLEALAEYNEVEARYNFLTTQAADLEQAVASLQEVIAELERVMERQFLATFKAVAAQFKEEFVNLFGGGSAKLVLTDPDSPSTTGVEIIARPPGKREQGLALLSGGERALTAAALIFSILKTRPTPFCVLDEVDAALDEANVGRFRDALKALSAQTQFILITHNRGTIEAADTIYGVSMGADNTSQTLSLKLNGHQLEPVTLGEA
ncbi:MAG: chromosome segregation protein SMC, partial [Anaerolineae bacterium]